MMNFMKSSLWSTHLKNPLRCSLVDMLCGKHLRRMHGDCSQEKPLDDDYVSYELNYHSIVPKANHSISQLSKSMPQPVTLKKLKLNGSVKTYKTF